MMEKIIKTPDRVAAQIERWFLMYHKAEKSSFNGTEVFTIFNHLFFEKQNEIIRKVELKGYEIPVLILFVGNNEYILNTTERFIRVNGAEIEDLFYSEFQGHKGYKSILAEKREGRMVVNIKVNGGLAQFGLMKKNGEIIYWIIPTGSPGFAFWNITNKFEIIGRRYLIKAE